MTDSDKLAHLLDEGAIDEILGALQTGKEAAIYVVRRGDEVVAAKIYKERDRRSFKNNAVYTEGRKTRNSRDERALARRSRHGKATQESAWKASESQTLLALHAAGVRVPRPISYQEEVLLMELVTDASGEPAPRLIDVKPTEDQAKAWHALLISEIARMLLAGWIHGDLSAYNVLIAARGPVIIDFPQAISASHNNQARRLVERDVKNVTEYLAGFAPELARHRNAGAELWTRYERGELVAEFVPGASPVEPDPEDELALQIAQATAMPATTLPGRTRPPRKGARRAERHETQKPEPPRAEPRRSPEPRRPEPQRAAKRPEPQRLEAKRPEPRRPETRRPETRRPEPRAPERDAPPPQRGGGGMWGHLADRYGLGEAEGASPPT